MATFDEFYASLDPDIGVRGKQFEKFIKWFLKTDPTWASQVDEVWLWNEYPKRWGSDCGIDLIFTRKNGEKWAVQAKCISPTNDIKKSEIDSFLSESNDAQIDGRLLIASTDGIGKNAIQVINRQEKQVVCFLLDQFRKSEIIFPSEFKNLYKGKRREKKKPRIHQIKAIDCVSEGLLNTDRGQVLMACGTGKTLTALWIKEKLKATQVLILLPSLSLLSQTLREWNREASTSFKWICVCSDISVAKDKSDDQWLSNTSEIGVPVTSDPLEIKKFLDESGSKVVFSTYQSSSVIVEAQKYLDTSFFDLVIADEAHRCAGRVSDTFGSVLDENKLKAYKRLFFTATPRILSKEIKNKSLEMDLEFASMDDHSIFGEILYQLKFSEAIAKDLLSDYRVLVIGVDDEMIKQKILNRELIKVDEDTILDAETIAAQIALIKAIKKYDMNRIITFHSKIKTAKNFANSFSQITHHINDSDLPSGFMTCEHISGNMKTSERNQKLNNLKNLTLSERRILTNARCLSEGVDVPSLSGIAFINPKQSQIDIIQAVGRAIRKSEDKTKATIVIPLYISKNESLDETILLSNFKKVWQIVIALKSQDDYLMDCIDKLRIQKGYEGKINTSNTQLDKFIFDIPEKITSKFPQSIKTLLVNNSSEGWYEKFGKLKNFYKKEGHSFVNSKNELSTWCSSQRQRYKNKSLPQEKIELLESIEFAWDFYEKLWQENFKKLESLYKKEGHSYVKGGTNSLASWSLTQRRLYRNNSLPKKKIELLESIEFVWDFHEKAWHDNFKKLQKFYKEEGHTQIPIDHSLASWNLTQRQKYIKNTLPSEKVKLLNSVEFIWDIHEKNWQDNFKKLQKFYEAEGHSDIQSGKVLGNWCLTQRQRFREKTLPQNKVELLESVQFKWNLHDAHWQINFDKLKSNFDKNGEIDIKDDSNLVYWCSLQRLKRKNNTLSQPKIDLLDELNFVWGKGELSILKDESFIWFEKYEKLKKFYDRDGHSNPFWSQPLGKWLDEQREKYKAKELSQEQILLLEAVEFEFE